MGVVANNPIHLAGAIDADGADKAARFLQLCDAFDLPVLFLCDTPGIMVGPDAERTALVRHVSRLFVTGANVTVPTGTIILRKGYGLGAQAMAGGSFKAPLFCVAWPTGELGGMGLEGAVRLGYRKELDAIADPAERERTFQEMVDRMYEHGKAVNAASHFEIDDVIDPADSRRWISTTFAAGACARRPPGQEAPQHRHLVRSVGSGSVTTKLWTGKGDDGTTGLLYGGRAPKSSPRLEAVGAADEAQAAIGVARAEVDGGSELDVILTAVCRDLWVLMAEVATDPANQSKLVEGQTLVSGAMVTAVEHVITDIGGRFDLPSEFVVPGQDRTSALLDLARTVVRRAERAAHAVAAEGSHVLPYLNRLSSLLWTLARWTEDEPLATKLTR